MKCLQHGIRTEIGVQILTFALATNIDFVLVYIAGFMKHEIVAETKLFASGATFGLC